MAIYNAKPVTKESAFARFAKPVAPTNVVTHPDKKLVAQNWFDKQLEPGETAYHTKLELLSNKIVELEKQQIEHIIPLLKNRIREFVEDNKSSLFKRIDELEKKFDKINKQNSSLFELNQALVKKIEQIQQKNVMLCELNVNLVKKVDAQIKEQLKTEDRLNKLEDDNKELRKIIDELRAPSKYM